MKKRPLVAAALTFLLWLCCCRLFGWLGEVPVSREMDGSVIVCEGNVCGIEYQENFLYLYLDHLRIEANQNISSSYRVKIITEQNITPAMGNRIQAKGKAAFAQEPSNAGQFDSVVWQRSQKLLFTLKRAQIQILDTHSDVLAQGMWLLQRQCMRKLFMVFEERDAGILGAMLLGDKTELDGEIRDWYQMGGISHILAISGLHISMLGMGIYRLFRKMGLSFGYCGLVSAGIMVCYAIMTGAGVATCRAVVMFLVFLGAQCLGRTYDLLSALALSILLLLFARPFLLFTSGFQLSVLAVAGIGAVQPMMKKAYGSKFPSGISIQLVLLPCILWHYYTFPPYGILLNVVVIPLLPVILGLGGAGMVLSCVCLPAAKAAGVLVHGLLELYRMLCELSLRLPFGQVATGCPKVWAIILYYAVLVCGLLLLGREHGSRAVKRTFPIFLLAAFCMLQRPAFSGLQLSFLDVGQGDCIFMRNEQGVTMLCDGGSSSVSSVGKYRILPFLQYHRVKRLDYVFLTHMDADHINGVQELLELLPEKIQVKTLVFAGNVKQDEAYFSMVSLAEKRGISIHSILAGDRLRAGRLILTCLHPSREFLTEDKNEASLAFHLQYESFDAMLMGDLEGKGEEYMIDSGMAARTKAEGGEIEVLKVGHHGSNGATSEALLSVLRPRFAVLSYGQGNRYGHPGKDLIKRLETFECAYSSTEKCGEITIFCDKNEKISIRYGKNVIE